MDHDEKKCLKKLEKSLVEKRSEELRSLLGQTNPSPFASDEYVRNEIEIRRKEMELRTDVRIRTAGEIHRHFILQPIDFDLNDYYPDDPNWFWECMTCGDFVPTCANDAVHCSCENIRLNGDWDCRCRFRKLEKVRLVRLWAMAEKQG